VSWGSDAITVLSVISVTPEHDFFSYGFLAAKYSTIRANRTTIAKTE